MIFEELVLHNFGVYQGRQPISLAVVATKPIVLIGALNGGGKTTFLDAMQLALYGKGAKCTGRERVGYQEYLGSMINRNVPSSHGAGVELSFRTRTQGQDSILRVKRTWHQRGQDIKENFEVWRDEAFDSVASERWQEFVEDFMPSQIADLFFFDGEKIEALADPQRSAALLRVGVHSLLGIDLVEELSRSLLQVERKRKTAGAVAADQSALDGLMKQLADLEQERQIASQRRAGHITDLDQARSRMVAAEANFSSIGGDLFKRRHELIIEQADLQRRKAVAEGRLRDVAAGVLPLQICKSLVNQAVALAKTGVKGQSTELLSEEATVRDSELVQYLKALSLDEEMIGQVSNYLKQDRTARYCRTQPTLALPPSLLDEFKQTELEHSCSVAVAENQELSDVNEKLVSAERHLAAMPDDAVIAQAQDALDKCRVEVMLLEQKISAAAAELEAIEDKRKRLVQQMNRESERLGKQMLEDEVSMRVVKQSTRARETLGKFKEHLLHANLDRLQMGIQQFFQQLLRKRTLVHGIRIDPETFRLSVISGTGQVVPAHRLSAGERQLLAVATLWALAHASGRHLPAVIDTPLSRLDSRHRGTLVKHYFPKASHQVILLSTDEEVVGKYHQQLEPYIGLEYTIDHDEELGTSRILPGYFSAPQDRVAA